MGGLYMTMSMESWCRLLLVLSTSLSTCYAAPTYGRWAINSTMNSTAAVSMLARSCDEGDNCYDMRMQNVQGCTSGWTLHGLWPQWAESCTSEKFDPKQVSSIRSELEWYWPSCEGSDESFWLHEWGKRGTCTKMSQLAYFKKALSLLQKYRSKCAYVKSGSCNVCFTQDLSSTMPCNS